MTPLAAAWRGVVDAMEQQRGLVSATVLINPRYVPVLRSHFGRHCTVLGPADDGRTRVRVAAHMPRAIAEQLAGWGSTVEVVEPASVREELARIGAPANRDGGHTPLPEPAPVSLSGVPF